MSALPEAIDPQLTIHCHLRELRFVVKSMDSSTLEVIYIDDEHGVESAIAVPNADARNLARALEMFADWFEVS
jgi:hypothetical protein